MSDTEKLDLIREMVNDAFEELVVNSDIAKIAGMLEGYLSSIFIVLK